MALSTTVDMPVMCLGEACRQCPELDIKVVTSEIVFGFDMHYTNYLECEHLHKCERIAKMHLEKASSHDE